MPTFTAIGFDLDNTLIDRDAAFKNLIIDWRRVLEGESCGLIDEILKMDDHGQGSREELFRYLANLRLFGGNCSGLWLRFQREFPGYFEPNDRINHSLQTLKDRGIPLAILSNGEIIPDFRIRISDREGEYRYEVAAGEVLPVVVEALEGS